MVGATLQPYMVTPFRITQSQLYAAATVAEERAKYKIRRPDPLLATLKMQGLLMIPEKEKEPEQPQPPKEKVKELSSGEQKVLETKERCRQRPHDPQRQEDLAQPRKKGGTARAWGVSDRALFVDLEGPIFREITEDSTSFPATSSTRTCPHLCPPDSSPQERRSFDPGSIRDEYSRFDPGSIRCEYSRFSATPNRRPLDKSEVESLLHRLTQPPKREGELNPGEQIVEKAKELEKERRSRVDLDSLSMRLAGIQSTCAIPTTGDRIVAEHAINPRRPVNRSRILEMAHATKSGGTSAAWGISPSDWEKAAEAEVSASTSSKHSSSDKKSHRRAVANPASSSSHGGQKAAENKKHCSKSAAPIVDDDSDWALPDQTLKSNLLPVINNGTTPCSASEASPLGRGWRPRMDCQT